MTDIDKRPSAHTNPIPTDVIPITVDSAYGALCCYTCGDPAADVVILIHGSGPTSSGERYRPLLPQLAMCGLYAVAIDCPGYGHSPGSRDTIRGDPAGVLRATLRGIGKTTAAALVGVSQGAAAVLRGVIADPKLASVLICDRALYAPMEELRGILHPCLLVYDKDDNGHPVKIGRRIKSVVRNSEYHEYSSKKDPTFMPDNYATMIVSFLQQKRK